MNNYKQEKDYKRLFEIENKLREEDDLTPEEINSLQDEQLKIITKRYKEYVDFMQGLYDSCVKTFGEFSELHSFQIRCLVFKDIDEFDFVTLHEDTLLSDGSIRKEWVSLYSKKFYTKDINVPLFILFDQQEALSFFHVFVMERYKEIKESVLSIQKKMEEINNKWEGISKLVKVHQIKDTGESRFDFLKRR